MIKENLPVFNIDTFKKTVDGDKSFYVEVLEEHVTNHGFLGKPHKHDFYLIVLFLEGGGTHTIDFNNYIIKPNTVFFMSPGQVHSWVLDAGTNGYIIFFKPEFYLINFDYKRLSEFSFFNTFTNQPIIEFDEKGIVTLRELFIRIYHEALGEGSRKWEVVCSYLDVILLKLSEAYIGGNQANRATYLSNQVKKLESFIETYYKSHKSVEEYAELMSLSTPQINRICKSAFNKSLGQLLQDRLILEAKRLLVHTDLSVSQISEELNFNDNSYFNRFFKRLTGQTPEHFRKNSM